MPYKLEVVVQADVILQGWVQCYDSIIWTFGTSWSLQSPPTMFHTSPVLFTRVSRPDKVFFPSANWKVTKSPEVEQDVGPAVEHIYEVTSRRALAVQAHRRLSRLSMKADPTVRVESGLPRAAMKQKKDEENVQQITP